MSTRLRPHAGLAGRFADREEVQALRERAATLPRLTLDSRELADLELIATGAAAPLEGFLGFRDYQGVLEHLRLASGRPWPLPFTLAVTIPQLAQVMQAGEAALHDGQGRLWAVLHAADGYVRNPIDEARAVHRTDDAADPGVAYLLSRPRGLVGGPVVALPLPDDGSRPDPLLVKRHAPAREALLRALVLRNGGATHVLFDGEGEEREQSEHILRRFQSWELGFTPLWREPGPGGPAPEGAQALRVQGMTA
jgi:sulfate adenylyltransferase